MYTGQPLDTIKVKLQTFPGYYRNAGDCFLKTLKNEGVIRGLYAGTGPALAANIAENSILFMSYGICQKLVGQIACKKTEQLNLVENSLAGSMAGGIASLVVCPTDLVKCRMQAMRETLINQSKNTHTEHVHM